MDLQRIKDSIREDYPGLPNWYVDQLVESEAEKVKEEEDE